MFRRTIKSVVAIGAVVLMVLSATAPVVAKPLLSAPPPPDRARALQAALDAVRDAGMPGLIAEVREGATVWRGSTGVADVTTGAPMRPWFEHRAGSMVKTFVATTLLQLVGEHRVRLSDPVGRYVGDLLPPDLAAQVTVRMLLQHTSGINDYLTTLFQSNDDIERYRTKTIAPARLVALGVALPRTNPPGASYFYSNTNYILAGLIIERITHRPVEFEIARRITVPLRLSHTYLPGTNPHIIGPHAKGYVPWNDGTLRDFSVYNMSWAWTAGGLTSTASDLNDFYTALLSGHVLPPELLTEMLTVVPFNPNDPNGAAYGLGIARTPFPCGSTWGHGSAVFGYGTGTLRMVDGSRQVTFAYNMTRYTSAPIDTALTQFMMLALCGPTNATA